jgi:hypothetical protein
MARKRGRERRVETVPHGGEPATTSNPREDRPAGPPSGAPTTAAQLRRRALDSRYLGLLCFVPCAAYALHAASVGWNNTISDAHGFRQSQTAITAYWMVNHPPTLAYETPVLGPPWPIPFEFPAYQWTVAGLVTFLGTPLIQTGRFVSLPFFFLSLAPLYVCLGVFRLSPSLRLLILSLVLVNPFYLFWSRTVLMESTALFFGMSFVAAVVVYCGRPSARAVVAAVLFGMLAGLTKCTTFAPFLAAALLVLLADSVRGGGASRRRLGNALVAGLIALSSIGITLAWTRYADALKVQNPLGQGLTSSALLTWNFGTWADRLDLGKWHGMVVKPLTDLQYHPLLLLAVAVLAVCARGRLVGVLVCLGLFLGAPLVFFGVHGHSYYAFANLVCFVAALGLCLAAGIEHGGWRRVAALLLFGLTVGVCVFRHQTLYLPLQARNARLMARVGAAVRRVSQPGEIVVVYGADWSAEIPFYAERRALMLPGFAGAKAADALRAVESCRVGAMVVVDPHVGSGWYPSPPSVLAEQRRQMGLSEVPSFSEQGIEVYPAGRLEETYRRYRAAEGAMAKSDWREAHAVFSRCCRELPEEPAFFLGRAAAGLRLGEIDEPLADCDRAVALEPADPGAHAFRAVLALDLARRLAATGRPVGRLLGEALASGNRAVLLAPEEPDGCLLRSRVYSALGRSADAARDREVGERLSRPPKRFLDDCARLVELEGER